jgi:GNAT superfamily N-acetyltransferase
MAYRVTAYDCATDLEKIKELAKLADSQQTGETPPFDPRVLPWVHGCEKAHKSVIKIRHYVAQKVDGSIVGWLLAETRNRFGRIYVYLSEISATRIPSPEHRGIGKALYDKLLEDAKKDGAYFIYLYPLTDAAKATYTKWGYNTPYDGLKQQFVELRPATDKKRVVPPRLVANLADPLPVTYFVEAYQLASDLGDKSFAMQIQEVSRGRKDDSDFVKKLKETLESISIFTEMPEPGEEPMSAEDQLAMLHEIFDPVIAKRGGGKTARNTHRLRFFRKHHLVEKGYSVGELAKISKVSSSILQKVYDRGIGAYKTNPTSVRMKGTFRKGVNAPYRMKLSKEQWAMARVYSFLDGNPKHDGDLRRKTRRSHK